MKRLMITLVAAIYSIGATAQQPVDDGIKMYNYKKFQSAQRILEPLATSDARANYFLGLSYLESGDPAKANTTFSKFPEDPANISGTARVAFAMKDATKGMQIAKDLAAKNKKKEWVPEKFAADAITYSDNADYHQAIAWYTDVLTKTDDADVHIAIGDAYRKISGGGGDAMNNYEHVTEKDQKNSLAYTRIGDLWYEAHNYQSALDNYEKAKNADPTNPLPNKSVADAYARSGKFQQALQNMKQYMDLSDNTLSDKIFYLEIQYEAQSYCDAAKYAGDLLNAPQLTQQQRIEITGILGYSQADCGDSITALKNLRAYFQMQNPAKIKAGDYIQLGKLFLKLDMLDSAGVYYNKGIAGDTAQNKTDIYRQIAEAFRLKKDWCKSADWYNNLVKANPNTQALDYFYRGYTYYYCRTYDAAVNAFKEFQAKYPTQPPAIYWVARSLAAIDSDATTGTAAPAFQQWLDTVGQDYYKQGGAKKSDTKTAYEYLLAVSFNKKEKDNIKLYEDKLREVDPADSVLKQIEDAEKSENAPRKAAPKGKK